MRNFHWFWGSAQRRAIPFAVLAWSMSSILTAIAGPFSTIDTMGFGTRLMYWSGVIGVSIIVGVGLRRIVVRMYPAPAWRADLAGSALIAVAFGTILTAFNAVVLGYDAPVWAALAVNMLVVLLVSLCVVVGRAYMRQADTGAAPDAAVLSRLVEDEGQADVARGPLPPFLRSIDPEIGSNVRWIEADDHYLRVHAPQGSARVLKRFRDALDELSGMPGLQVHRSYWVRLDSVAAVRADGRRHVAILSCGTEVPVSRPYLTGLKDAGLFQDDAA